MKEPEAEFLAGWKSGGDIADPRLAMGRGLRARGPVGGTGADQAEPASTQANQGRTRRIGTLRTWLLGGILLGLVQSTAGCATGRVIEGMYRDPAHAFQVRLPPATWVPAPLDGAALSFRAPELRAAMALAVECRTPEAGALPWVARHLFFGLELKRVQTRESVRLHDVPAVRTRLQATLDDSPVEVEGVTFRRAECLYDFVYVAPPALFASGRLDFAAFVESWTPLSEQ